MDATLLELHPIVQVALIIAAAWVVVTILRGTV